VELQIIKLWYPYLSVQEAEDAALAAPTGHPAPAPEPVDQRTWQEEDITALRKEFRAMDASGDGLVDRHVRRRARWLDAGCCCVASGHALEVHCLVRHRGQCATDTHRLTVRVQEFQQAMLDLWGMTPDTKGYRRYQRMVNDWFEQVDVDGSDEIEFGEFQDWYMLSPRVIPSRSRPLVFSPDERTPEQRPSECGSFPGRVGPDRIERHQCFVV
jgi:hypothetical protein